MRSEFEYLRPSTMDEAIGMFQEHQDGAVYWAGGTDLVLQWKSEIIRPTHCIDLSQLSDYARIEMADGEIRIGALTSLTDIALCSGSNPLLDCLATTAELMCTVQTRTIATIGGNLCNASPAADLSPPLAAMGATVHTLGPDGERSVAVEDLATGPRRTTLKPGEIVTSITIPAPDNPIGAAYRRVDRTAVDIALVSASSALSLDTDGKIEKAQIALGAVAPTVVLSPAAREMLIGCSLEDLTPELMKEAGNTASASATPISDVRASAEYRKAMIKVLVSRTLDDVRLSLLEQVS